MTCLPTGPGIWYEKRKCGKFRWESLLPKGKWSYPAIHWLNYLQNSSEFKYPDVIIRHAMNGGEIKVTLFDQEENCHVNYMPDGYTEVNGERIFFEYDGCKYHNCPENCKLSLDNASYHLDRDDEKRDRIYKQHGRLIKISGCQWHKLKKTVNFKCFTSCFFGIGKLIPESDIWEKIKSGEFFGLIKADVKSSAAVIDKFGRINFPPIFNHVEITEDMIGDKMRKQMGNRKFPLQKQLTLVFNATNYMMTTEMVLFYLEIGCELSNLSMAIEYERDTPMKSFVEKITASRVKATLDGDDAGQMTYKLVANRLSLKL